MSVGTSEKEIKIVAPGKVDPMEDEHRLDGLLDGLLGVEADDVILHVRLIGKPAAGAQVAVRAPQQDIGDLALLRTGQ